jgi:hypothetical protein
MYKDSVVSDMDEYSRDCSFDEAQHATRKVMISNLHVLKQSSSS